jgi:Protein of unknown function (DUF3293)
MHNDGIGRRSTLPAAVLHAYLATRYRVFSDEALDLRVGEHNLAIDSLLARHAVTTAVLVTAWNPFSRPTLPEQNSSQQSNLVAQIERAGFIWLRAEGADPAGNWPVEDSAFVLGANRADADQWLTAFEQNAVLFVRTGERPELLLHPMYR